MISIALAILAALGLLIFPMPFFVDSMDVFFLGAIIIVLNMSFLIRRVRQHGLGDVLSFFYIFFFFYNSLMVISSAAFIVTPNRFYPKEMVILSSTYYHAGVLVLLALLGSYVGERFLSLFSQDRTNFQIKNYQVDTNALFVAGLLVVTLGLVMMLIYFGGMSQMMHYAAMERVMRLNILTNSSSMHLPYLTFIYSGIAVLSYVFVLSNNMVQKAVIAGVITLWVIIQLIMRNRYYIILPAIEMGLIYLLTKKLYRIKFSYVLILLLVYFTMILSNFVKPIITDFIKGENASFAYTVFHNNMKINNFNPAVNDMGGPYLSLLFVTQNETKPLYGKSYLSGLLSIVPQKFLPFEKSLSINQQFSNKIHQLYSKSPTTWVVGWGFNPVAEAFLNFSTRGVFVVFMLFSMLLHGAMQLSYRYKYGVLFAANVAAATMALNRSAFYDTLNLIFFMFFGVIVAIVLTEILQLSKRVGRNNLATNALVQK